MPGIPIPYLHKNYTLGATFQGAFLGDGGHPDFAVPFVSAFHTEGHLVIELDLSGEARVVGDPEDLILTLLADL